MKKVFSKAKLTPKKIAAGDSNEFIIALTVGSGYTKGPSRIVFDFPATIGYTRPTLVHREDHGFVEVYVSNAHVKYQKKIWDMERSDFMTMDKVSYRGMALRMFVLELSEGLKKGDTIEMHWGDIGGGYGSGTKVTTIVPESNYENTIHVRYFDSQEKGLPDMGRSYKGYVRPEPECEIPLKFKIIPRSLHHLRLVRKPDKAMLLPLDVFCNVAPVKDLSKIVDVSEKPLKNGFDVFEFSNKKVEVISRKIHLLDAPTMDNVFDGMNIYWGDIHTHSAFSVDCIEREKLQMKPDDLMGFARQRACLDFFAVTDHHQPWDIERHKIGKELWDETIEAVRKHNKSGEFLVFPGIEFRHQRGDTAVVFNWLPEYEEIDDSSLEDIRALWNKFKGKDYITIPHFHNPGSLPESEWYENISSGVETTLEIFSCHGSYEREDVLESGRSMIKTFRSHRHGAYFISKGYHYGFVCNSDGHKGHVGSNGVTAVFSKSLDKKSIFEAFRKRHVYGTTNAKIRLVFTGNDKLMGSILPNTGKKKFFIDVAGENRIKKVDVFKNANLYKTFIPEGKVFQTEFTSEDSESSNWYVRITQIDNHIAFSSPIWFE